MENCPEIDVYGNKIWKNPYGEFHREDGPAIIYADGREDWYINGLIHRDGDLPAITTRDGYMAWYQYGYRQRDGEQPAVIYADGVLEWYQRGKYHRDGDKPALIGQKNEKITLEAWYKNDRLHRTCGPASIDYLNNEISWAIDGKYITDSVNEWMQKMGVSWPWNEETQTQFLLAWG